MNDWELIDAYVRESSESAFRSLVQRYALLVHASALRQTDNKQMAEDIAQAVFTLLARRASSLKRNTIVVGWLFQTTRFVTSRALRSEQRRQRREKEALEMQQLDATNETWRQMLPVIDEALGRLGATDRNAILLRYFDDRSLLEIGESLGMTEEAARKRVTRAVEKLRRLLGRRGVTVSATVISTVLGSQLAAATTETIVTSVTANSLALAGGSSASSLLVTQTLVTERWLRFAWLTGTIATAAVVLFLIIRMGRDVQSAAAVASFKSEMGQAKQFVGAIEAQHFDISGKLRTNVPNWSGKFNVFVKDHVWRTSYRPEAEGFFRDLPRQTFESGGDGTNVYSYIAPAGGTSRIADKQERYMNSGSVYRTGDWYPSSGAEMVTWLAYAGNCLLREPKGNLAIHDLDGSGLSFSYERVDDPTRNGYGPSKVRVFAEFAGRPDIPPFLVKEFEVMESRREDGYVVPALVELRDINRSNNVVWTQAVFRVSAVALKQASSSEIWIKPSAPTSITDYRLDRPFEYITTQWITLPVASSFLESGKANARNY